MKCRRHILVVVIHNGKKNSNILMYYNLFNQGQVSNYFIQFNYYGVKDFVLLLNFHSFLILCRCHISTPILLVYFLLLPMVICTRITMLGMKLEYV